jgi:hypothetical protein
MEGVFHGQREAGARDNRDFMLLACGPRHILFTGNSDTPYGGAAADLQGGPIVVELPPGPFIALAMDHHQRWILDMGLAGPDLGKGGKHLILPPGYSGEVPSGYQVARSATFKICIAVRALPQKGDLREALDAIRAVKVYPLATAANPAMFTFLDLSEREIDATLLRWEDNLTYWQKLHAVIDTEPVMDEFRPMYGLLAAIGIEKGRPFAPDARMKKILTEAAYVANATARAIIYRTRMPDSYFYPNSAWKTAFVAGNHEFLRNGARILDARTLFHFYATGITPAMRRRCRPAWGRSTRWHSSTRRTGRSTAARTIACTCHRTFPRRTSGRSCSTTIRRDHSSRPIRSSRASAVKRRASRSIQIGRLTSTSVPRRRPARKSNWIQTWPGKGWNVILWPYGPLPSWFDKTWRPAESEEVP